MSKEDDNLSTKPEIGQILKRAREEQGLSFERVEQATKIRAVYLRELERGNFDVLPPAYTRGSLKTYANFLRLDGAALARELERQQDPMQEESTAKGGEDQSAISRVYAGLWGLISARIDLRSFLGYLGLAAVLILGLPLMVYGLTLIGPDSKPVPMQTATAGGKRDQGLQPQRRGDEGNGRLLAQQDGTRNQGAEVNGARQARQDAKGPDEPRRAQSLGSAAITGASPSAVTSDTAPTLPPAASGSTPTASAPASASPAPTAIAGAPEPAGSGSTPTSSPTSTEAPPAPDGAPVDVGQDAAANVRPETPARIEGISVPNPASTAASPPPGTGIAEDVAPPPPIGRPLP